MTAELSDVEKGHKIYSVYVVYTLGILRWRDRTADPRVCDAADTAAAVWAATRR